MKKRILSAVLVSGVTLSAAASVHAEDYDSQIAATNNAISNLASQQEAAQAQVATIQSQVSTLRTQKTELEAKEKLIAELKTSIESLKKEISLFKNKNSALLTNETVFAVEKKKYLDSVENTLKKGILQESIKIPNLQNLNDAERKDKMIELLEKTSKENNIPFSAFEEVFKDSNKTASFLNLLGGRKNHEQLEEKQIVKFRR